MRVMVEVDRLAICRGPREVLRDVSFQVDDGEFLVIVGPNGAGKTTLLVTLLGFLQPIRGGVRLRGQPVSRYRRRQLARLVSYVPQAESRPIAFSVEAFVMLGRYAHRGRFAPPDREDRRVVDEALGVTRTTGFRERTLSSLSGGERQRVCIAAALAQQAPLLLLDEPTVFLDPRHQVETADLLRELNRSRGLTVVMVTHDINLAVRSGRQILALDDGCVVYDGTTEGLLAGGVLDALYGLPFEVLRRANGGFVVAAGDL